jgi:hypothetical protein
MYLKYKAKEKWNKREGVLSRGTILGRSTQILKKRRKPLKQVIHSYQFQLARFRDIQLLPDIHIPIPKPTNSLQKTLKMKD